MPIIFTNISTNAKIRMKIAIKKKYIMGIAYFISLVLGFDYLQGLIRQLSGQNISVLIKPLIFLTTTIYSVNFWWNLKANEKLADEVSREVSKGDPLKADELKNHLFNKHYEEEYTLNIFKGKIKFTSSWPEQEKLEKITPNKYIPDIIKQEFIKKTKK